MLSFDLSAIDLVLVIAAVIILLLYVIRPSQSSARSSPSVKEKRTGIRIKIFNIFRSKKIKASSQVSSFKCPYYFGYLNNISNESSIPEECYICPRMIQCAAREAMVGSSFNMED